MAKVTLKVVIYVIKKWNVAKCPSLHDDDDDDDDDGDGGAKYTHRIQV
jgi:hypothetical protein